MPLRLPSDAWVLVCDGAKALMLRNEGDAITPSLRRVDVFEEPAPPTRELGTDRPGRVHASNGTARSATEETDLHDQAEADFLGRTAAALDRLVRQEGVKHLILAAPPRALGVLREKLSPHVRQILQGEINKDLTGMPLDQIEKHLLAV
ncbi:host attachment protein [Roseococcus sp. YIM B11640]|uniref:baeRF12 domain-containing protein n=1 Tax=Roseococcus sp. YIM B11640 TaxID=3133973 RepID=UPI003C7E2BD0